MTAPSAETLGTMIGQAIRAGIDGRDRSLQKDSGILGPSDIGFCRQKAALVTRQIPASDARKVWAAGVGTAIHSFVEDILQVTFPTWLIEKQKVTARLINGVEISGTPDILIPEWNMVIDLKTVDGYAWVKRAGVSQNHTYQRFLYALGACQEGILDKDEPLHVVNVYLDRSGTEQDPYVAMDLIDWGLENEIAAWVDDVIYAVQHKEDAQRDIAAPVCEKICEFFTVCRGSLPSSDDELIDDPELTRAVEMYVEGRTMENTGKQMKREASGILRGISGSTGEWQVRWTSVAPVTVDTFERDGYDKIDVRKVRKVTRG